MNTYRYMIAIDSGATGSYSSCVGSSAFIDGSRRGFDPEKMLDLNYYDDALYSREDLIVWMANYLMRFQYPHFVQTNKIWEDRNEYKFYRIPTSILSARTQKIDPKPYEITETQLVEAIKDCAGWKSIELVIGMNLGSRMAQSPIEVDIYVNLKDKWWKYTDAYLTTPTDKHIIGQTIIIPSHVNVDELNDFISKKINLEKA